MVRVQNIIITAGIKVPPPVKRRGRPKGHGLTTIGLPAKRARKEGTRKPCSFSKLHVSEKERGKVMRRKGLLVKLITRIYRKRSHSHILMDCHYYFYFILQSMTQTQTKINCEYKHACMYITECKLFLISCYSYSFMVCGQGHC